MNGAGTLCEGPSPGRCSPVRQRRPGRYPTTVRTKWNKEVNKVVMECFYRSKPFDENGKPIRGYRQRMFREWRNRGGFESTEQRICDQARAIRKNCWLSELELEMIKRSVIEEEEREANNDVKDGREQVDNENCVNVDVNNGNVVNDVNVEENDQQNGGFVVEDNVLENILSESQRGIIENLRKIYAEKKTTEGISFKKVDKNKLKKEMNRVRPGSNVELFIRRTQCNELSS